MEFLKKFFPMSFTYVNSGKELTKGIIIQAVIAIVVGFVTGIIIGITDALAPEAVALITNVIFSAISSFVGIYTTAGIALEILVFVKVIKR